MEALKKLRTALKLKALRDHPNTGANERRAAQLALDRIGPVTKPGEICFYCARELGLRETGMMVFTTQGACDCCGATDLPVSEDWV